MAKKPNTPVNTSKKIVVAGLPPSLADLIKETGDAAFIGESAPLTKAADIVGWPIAIDGWKWIKAKTNEGEYVVADITAIETGEKLKVSIGGQLCTKMLKSIESHYGGVQMGFTTKILKVGEGDKAYYKFEV